MPRRSKTAHARTERPIRAPGASPTDLDDAQLRDVTDPDVLTLLSPLQLKRRRLLRQQAARKRRKERQRLARRVGYKATHMLCAGENTDNEPCESRRVTGSDYCAWHMDESERKRLSVLVPGGISRKQRAPELLRQVMEVAQLKIIEPYLDALGIEVIGFDQETNEPILRDTGGGLTLHGESKDGDIVLTPYPDVVGRIAAAEKLFDRVYGKPKQTTQLEGGVTPIKVQPVRSIDRAQAVADILMQARAIPDSTPAPATPHEGRQRRQSADVIDMPGKRS
jgi:hypothetical protein